MMPSEADRIAAVHHVVHEYANFVSSAEMVRHGTDIYGTHFQPPINTHVSHAFYLNCRKLADFFQNRLGPDKDDILAEHFLPGYRAALPICDGWRTPMNKQLAHVTYYRDKSSREIDSAACMELYRELKSTWRDFRTGLPEPFRSEFVRKIKERKDPYADGKQSEFKDYDLD